MTSVVVHIYDVTNSDSEKTNNTILQINKFFKDGIGLGGIFHSAVQILRELSTEWPGDCYDLLSKNCNHFCDEFCERLGVPKLPGWVNRFANAGDTAVEIAGNTAYRFRQAKTEIVTASRVAYQFLAGIASTTTTDSLNDPNEDTSTPRFQQPAWFKNLVAAGAKPSTSTTLENGEENIVHNLSPDIQR